VAQEAEDKAGLAVRRSRLTLRKKPSLPLRIGDPKFPDRDLDRRLSVGCAHQAETASRRAIAMMRQVGFARTERGGAFTIPAGYAISDQPDRTKQPIDVVLTVFIDADGPWPGGFVQLGSNFNFGSGFDTTTLPRFTDHGTSDFFRIVGGTNNNAQGMISGITVASVQEPVVDAGLPSLVMVVGGFLGWRRRPQKAA
jgi:hypothetical protein